MHNNIFPTTAVAKLTLPGPVGDLEVMTTWPQALSHPKAVGIVCHPHPLHAGSMHNKVVTTLAKTLGLLGLATVRFNYRGVGHSAGSYGQIVGEIDDLYAIKSWVQQQLPDLSVWLAGFSFGAYIAANVTHHSTDVTQLITVAPAINHARFDDLTAIDCPWLLIQGESDELIAYEQVKAFAEHPPSPLRFITLPETSHFFHGRLHDLQRAVEQNVIGFTY